MKINTFSTEHKTIAIRRPGGQAKLVCTSPGGVLLASIDVDLIVMDVDPEDIPDPGDTDEKVLEKLAKRLDKLQKKIDKDEWNEDKEEWTSASEEEPIIVLGDSKVIPIIRP